MFTINADGLDAREKHELFKNPNMSTRRLATEQEQNNLRVHPESLVGSLGSFSSEAMSKIF